MLERLMICLQRWFGTVTVVVPAETAAPKVAPPTSKKEEPPAEAAPNLARAQNLIKLAVESTETVAQDVGEHHATIQTLNTALSAVAEGDVAAVASIVCQLIVANQSLQGRLERAELKLQTHSRQLSDAVSAARTDALTGLLNRRALDDELNRALTDCQRRGRAAALLMLDVDRFKRFNDVHGHVGGDHGLTYVAEVLRAHSRESDIVARYGGEEFVIIFSGSSASAVCHRAEQIRRAVGEGRAIFEGREARLTASAGLAEISRDDTVESWVKRADAALYAAKNGGRDCAFLHTGSGTQKIVSAVSPAAAEESDGCGASVRKEAAAELAAEAFADTTFVSQVARRIAEWRRGGSTFSVLLARLDCLDVGRRAEETAPQLFIRAALAASRNCVREMDLITRWGEDGLAVLMPNTGVFEAKTMARRLREALARCDAPAPECQHISMSMGIAEGMEGNDAHRVLQRAWMAQGAAHSCGTGNIHIHDGVKAVGMKLPAYAG